jgi:hypothetical protein
MPNRTHHRQSPRGRHLQRLRDRLAALGRRGRIASAASLAAVLVVAAGGVAFALTGSHAPPRHHAVHGTSTDATTSTLPHPKLDRHLCPLTGQRAPGGKVPQRPAIGIKIGNDPAARPQSGLIYADIVYEEMAEGGITRYLAVFQCHEAPVLGPVRSVRWDDWHVLASYGHPILAYSGGISYWEQLTAHLSWLYDADATFYPAANAYYRTSNRYPPENLYTSTAALWKLDPSNHEPPPPQFQYRPLPAAGAESIASMTIVGFSEGENVTWTWDPAAKAWLRFQGGVPDTDASGVQLRAANVLVQFVHTYPGPYYESGTTYGVHSITEGTGTAYLLRDGKLERGTWHTPAYGDTMELRLSNGDLMALQPGNTWVEMVPVTYAVQFNK